MIITSRDPGALAQLPFSTDLYRFLHEWHHWATRGLHPKDQQPLHHPIFSARHGLCANAKRYDSANGTRVRAELLDLMQDEFPDTPTYPFGDRQSYNEDSAAYRQHLNPKRLEWVQSKLNQYDRMRGFA